MTSTQTPSLTLGLAVRHARVTRTKWSARGLSLHAGLSESYVGKVEHGAIEPSFRAFAKIATCLGLTAAEVFLLINREAEQP